MQRSTGGCCSFTLLVAVIGIVFCFVECVGGSSHHASNNTSNGINDLRCQVILNHVVYEPDSQGHTARDEFYGCHPILPSGGVSGQMFKVELPDHIGQDEKERIRRGQPVVLSVPGGTLSLEHVRIPNATAVHVVNNLPDSSRRKLRIAPAKEGVLSLLPIRIITPDSEPTYSADRLHEVLFLEEVSLNQQMRRCSFDKLGFKPTKYGVLEVFVDVNAKGSPYSVISNAADALAIELVDEVVENIREAADLVMFIIPPGTNGGWAAYGNVNGVGTTFNNRWAAYPGAQMHEIGHNLGLFHAKDGGNEYGDTTGSMGSAPDIPNYPKRCFNGHNNWYLGWYDDRSIEVDPNSSTLLKVAAFVHYNRTISTDYVVVKVRDHYMQYNRAIDFNSETGEKQNQLTIVRKESRGTDLIASLDKDNPLSKIMLDDGELLIEVCAVVPGDSNTPDSMLVSIGFGTSNCPRTYSYDCIQGFGLINCAPPPLADVSEPSPVPTSVPTSVPTARPTPSPVRQWMLTPLGQLTRTRMPSPFKTNTWPPNPTPAPVATNIFQDSPTEQPFSDVFVDETDESEADGPRVPSIEGEQSVREERDDRMRIAFFVIAGTVGMALLATCFSYVRYWCLPKIVYYDVDEKDEEMVPTAVVKYYSETDSSVSSDSTRTTPDQEFFVRGLAESPAAKERVDLDEQLSSEFFVTGVVAGGRHDARGLSGKGKQNTEGAQHRRRSPSLPTKYATGRNLQIVEAFEDEQTGIRSMRKSPQPTPSWRISERSSYQSTPTARLTSDNMARPDADRLDRPAPRSKYYLDDSLDHSVVSLNEPVRMSRLSTRVGQYSFNDSTHSTLHRTPYEIDDTARQYRASPDLSSLYYDNRSSPSRRDGDRARHDTLNEVNISPRARSPARRDYFV